MALDLISRYNPLDLPCSLMASMYTVHLRFLMATNKPLEEEMIVKLREIVNQCRKFAYYDIMIEAWLVCYDILVAHRMWSNEKLSDCVRELVKLKLRQLLADMLKHDAGVTHSPAGHLIEHNLHNVAAD